MGFSVGGVYALGMGEALQAEIAIAFSTVYANDTFLLKTVSAMGATAFDPICACRRVDDIRLINVLASKNEFDCLNSRRLKKTVRLCASFT